MIGSAPATRLPVEPAPAPVWWRWEPVTRDDDVEGLVPAWHALAQRSPLPTFAGPAFTLAQRVAFLSRPDELTLHTLRRNGELVAVLPLRRQGGLGRGWQSIANDHTSCWGFAMRSDLPEVAPQVLDHLLATGDRLSLHRLHRDGPQWDALREAATALGLDAGARATGGGDTWLALPSSLDALDAAMPPHLARDLHGKLARLRRAGRVEVDRIGDGPGLAPALEECFALEAEGWKGFTGTPVQRDPAAHRFYCELARRQSAVGQLALYLLRVDGQLVAFRLCLRGGERLDSLKTSFAPAWARFTPGLLIQLLAIRHEVEDGVVRTMHVGEPSAHKLRWASGVLPLATLEVYSRRPRGRVAAWGPRLRDRLGRLPALRRVGPRWHAFNRRLHEARHDLRVRVGKVLLRRSGPKAPGR